MITDVLEIKEEPRVGWLVDSHSYFSAEREFKFAFKLKNIKIPHR
jgi:hypothetical protein